jgi:hypothetical protein
MSNKPLAEIKIINFTHVQAGPACERVVDMALHECSNGLFNEELKNETLSMKVR